MLCENDNLAGEARLATQHEQGRGATFAAMMREGRREAQAFAAAAEADRQHHRTRPRERGDRRQSFADDADRFALAMMAAVRHQRGTGMVRFGTGRSDWSAARHAAALFAPGAGQRVAYEIRTDEDTVRARATFAAGRERHDAAARRLLRKYRALAGVARQWVGASGLCLAMLNSEGMKPGARRYVWALLAVLGWRALPRHAFDRLGRLLQRQ